MDFKTLIYVGAGGAAGSICRYIAGYAVSKAITMPFPLATISINIVGSFIIGLLFGIAAKGNSWLVNDGGMWLLATGFCGGFTTFSAFALENINLIRNGQSSLAILYSVISVAGGLLLCRLGVALTA